MLHQTESGPSAQTENRVLLGTNPVRQSEWRLGWVRGPRWETLLPLPPSLSLSPPSLSPKLPCWAHTQAGCSESGDFQTPGLLGILSQQPWGKKESLGLPCSVQAATVAYPTLGALHSKCLFLPGLEASKSKVKVPVHLVSGESLLPDLQAATIQICPHQAGVGRGRFQTVPPLQQALTPAQRGHPYSLT